MKPYEELTYLGRVRRMRKLVRPDGDVHAGSRDWNDALAAGRALVKSNRGSDRSRTDVFARIAEEAAGQGDLEAAQKGFRKALRVKPDSVRARLGLARQCP